MKGKVRRFLVVGRVVGAVHVSFGIFRKQTSNKTGKLGLKPKIRTYAESIVLPRISETSFVH